VAARGEEAAREEAARKGPAVEAAVAAVKGARAEREEVAMGEEAAMGGVWIVNSWVEVQPVPGLTHFQQPAVRREEIRQPWVARAARMEEIGPKYLRKQGGGKRKVSNLAQSQLSSAVPPNQTFGYNNRRRLIGKVGSSNGDRGRAMQVACRAASTARMRRGVDRQPRSSGLSLHAQHDASRAPFIAAEVLRHAARRQGQR